MIEEESTAVISVMRNSGSTLGCPGRSSPAARILSENGERKPVFCGPCCFSPANNTTAEETGVVRAILPERRESGEHDLAEDGDSDANIDSAGDIGHGLEEEEEEEDRVWDGVESGVSSQASFRSESSSDHPLLEAGDLLA